jgi:TolB-like protein/TPR repeat protein
VLDPVEDVQIAESAHEKGRSAAFAEYYGEKSIAVLPFSNLSPDESNRFFTDGIHDDLLTRISNIQDIKTISRSSVMTYRDSGKSLQTIAKELRVGTILEGGVQRAGDQVRINLKLIDVESKVNLWAQTYTRDLSATNVFVVQAEITEAVAGALQAVLTEDERRNFQKQPTANLQALDAYFLGNQYFDELKTESVEKAIIAYQSAVALDPEFAQAFSNLAQAFLEQIWLSGYPVQAQLEKSRPLIDEAILLDPQSTSAFTALGIWFQWAGDLDKAEKAYVQALELGPNNAGALANYGNLKMWLLDDPASAVGLLEKAVELDPQTVDHKIQLAEAMGRVGLAKEAITLLERSVKDQPLSSNGYRVLGNLYSEGEFRNDKAMKALRTAYDLDPGAPWSAFAVGNMYYRMGDFDNSVLWLNHAARLAPASEIEPDFRGWAYLNGRNFESARREFDRSTSGSTLHWLGVFMLARVDVAAGRPEDAIRRYMAFAPRFNGKKSIINFNFGVGAINAYRAMGEHQKAQALTDELMAIVDAVPPLNYHGVNILDACLYAVSGQTEAAIATLEQWVYQGGASSFLQTLTEFELSILAKDSRYQELLLTVNNRLAEQRENLARWESAGEMPPFPKEVTDSR